MLEKGASVGGFILPFAGFLVFDFIDWFSSEEEEKER